MNRSHLTCLTSASSALFLSLLAQFPHFVVHASQITFRLAWNSVILEVKRPCADLPSLYAFHQFFWRLFWSLSAHHLQETLDTTNCAPLQFSRSIFLLDFFFVVFLRSHWCRIASVENVANLLLFDDFCAFAVVVCDFDPVTSDRFQPPLVVLDQVTSLLQFFSIFLFLQC